MANNIKNNSAKITQRQFGTLSNGETATLYTLTNTNNVRVDISNYGGIIVALETPDKHGNLSDIVLGYDEVRGYENDPYYLGAIIGRFAGRIDKGLLSIDNITYQLSLNNNNSQLHGGFNALNKQLWHASTETSVDSVSLILQHCSPDGENGFPGNVNFNVKYSLNNDNELIVEYFARTDKPTVINLTQHSYFNLAGHQSGSIYQHQVQLNADHFLPMNKEIYPTGEIKHVANSPHDFRQFATLGNTIHSYDRQISLAQGYDNFWLMNESSTQGQTFAAKAYETTTGRELTLYSDQPCIVLYTANYIDGSQTGKNGCAYQKHDAFCLEPQRIANRYAGAHINHTILRPETPFYSQSRYVFSYNN